MAVNLYRVMQVEIYNSLSLIVLAENLAWKGIDVLIRGPGGRTTMLGQAAIK